MVTRQRDRKATQSNGRARRKPGSGGSGNYYHIEVRDDDFETFRTQDVGEEGHIQRVAGKRESGSWATVKWLVSKEDAHIEDGRLVPDTQDARDLIKKLRRKPVHLEGDRFESKPRRNIPERTEPTDAQTRARKQNIRKAQQARKKS